MDTYRLALFCHLLALLGAITASGLAHFAERRMLAASSRTELRQWARMVAHIEPVFPVALLTLVATGAYMVHRAWSWDAGFVDAGLAGVAVLFVVGVGVLGPRMRVLLRALDADAEVPVRLVRDPVARAASWVNTGVALGVVFAMTVKPSLAGAIAALVVGAAAGATLGLLLLRRSSTASLRAVLTTMVVLAAAALIAACAAGPASAVSVKRCGSVSGPTAHVGTATFSHYGVFGVGIDCGFAKSTVASIVKQHLPNSRTPTRAKAPSGWICVADEVESHVAVAGHCQKGHASAFSWVGIGLHL